MLISISSETEGQLEILSKDKKKFIPRLVCPTRSCATFCIQELFWYAGIARVEIIINLRHWWGNRHPGSTKESVFFTALNIYNIDMFEFDKSFCRFAFDSKYFRIFQNILYTSMVCLFRNCHYILSFFIVFLIVFYLPHKYKSGTSLSEFFQIFQRLAKSFTASQSISNSFCLFCYVGVG